MDYLRRGLPALARSIDQSFFWESLRFRPRHTHKRLVIGATTIVVAVVGLIERVGIENGELPSEAFRKVSALNGCFALHSRLAGQTQRAKPMELREIERLRQLRAELRALWAQTRRRPHYTAYNAIIEPPDFQQQQQQRRRHEVTSQVAR